VGCLLDSGSAEFAPAERAAVQYAEELTKNPKGVSEATFLELRRHWNERQIVEITAVACLFNAFNRFNNALGVDLTVYPKKLG
jgi:alkylhydroperoxidase family enzyme